MNRAALLLLTAVVFTGCSAFSPKPKAEPDYRAIFNQAISANQTVPVVSALSFSSLDPILAEAIDALGYKETIYTEPQEGFIVLARVPSTLAEAPAAASRADHILMLKFTEWHGGQTRVDFVNIAKSEIAAYQVNWDIQRLIAKIPAQNNDALTEEEPASE